VGQFEPPAMIKKLPTYIIAFLFFVVFYCPINTHGGLPASSTLSPEKSYREIQQHIYHFRFKKASEELQAAKQLFPSNSLTYLAEVNLLWWLIITEPENKNHLINYQNTIDLAIRQIEQKKVSNGNIDEFALMNLYAFRTRIDVGNGEYIKAARSLGSCIGRIEKSLGHEDEFEAFCLTSGLYLFATDYGSQKYPLLKLYTLLYPKGDQAKGIDLLAKGFHSDDNILKVESAYFLMRIYAHVIDQPYAAFPYAAWLSKNFPENMIYQFYFYELLQIVDPTFDISSFQPTIRIIGQNQQLSPAQKRYFKQLFSNKLNN